MPLKHFTETFLVVVLGAAIALTGLLTSTLPDLPDGALPWAALFLLSVIYPLSLYSLFQRRRADNFFRNLHWFPAVILLAWLLLQGITLGVPLSSDITVPYTWGWTLIGVVAGFVLLVAFCLKVIRRRTPRLTFLAVILIPFAAAAFMSERRGHWEQDLASALWGADFWNVDNTGVIVRLLPGSQTATGDKNLEPSDNAMEEDWRERLRMQKNREERIAARMADAQSSSEGKSSISDMMAMQQSSVSSNHMMASVSSKPAKLPDAGMDWSIIMLTMVGAYCAALHRKTCERSLEI